MFVVFLLLWIVFNGRITVEILLIGTFLCAALFAFCCRFLGYSVKKDVRFVRLLPIAVQYVVALGRRGLLWELLSDAVLPNVLEVRHAE